MDLTPPGYRQGQGVLVASKGKCSLLLDTDGDDRANKEIVVATGWKELPHGVDALGAAFGKDGSIYFGLGAADYTNAYLLDQKGKAHYRLDSERGTVLRVSPDFSKREIVSTGIRFSVGLAFNRAGDLFCTDQEGATWLPNGNPLDELLHLEKGRHYGFPPRHPRHLPGVIDEPSVFDYGPQHQSTCGLFFNEQVAGGPVFGPAWWRSDALITGYSRGKLYRTRLVKTAGGYVAQNQLIAALGMLACDACVSPKGDLVVCVHSGGPDWGSGPNGKGKLYKISYTHKELPQPALIWAQGPREVRVAFDRPLPPEQLKDLSAKAAIEYGRYVAAGDRFEQLWPGYQAVQDQLAAPRYELPARRVQVSGDRRTLILETTPQSEAVSYALTLPGLGRRIGTKGELPQVAETDLLYDLCGVEAEWRPKDGTPLVGWLPHLDLTAARQLTSASALHDELWERCKTTHGKLVLRTKLNLWDMLRPAVQPGSTIDYTWPPEQVTLVFRGPSDMKVKVLDRVTRYYSETSGSQETRVTVNPAADGLIRVEVALKTYGLGPVNLSVAYHTNEDKRERALPLRRFLLPWATLRKEAPAPAVVREIPELKGGNWARGRKVFFSDEAACSKCHAVGGKGGAIGPDLSNLPHRDYQSVLRDIQEPSFTINPDYITYVVELKDGRTLTGALRSEGDKIHLGDTNGKVTTFRRADVEQLTASPLSVMPEGLPKILGPEKMRDLLTFLLSPPPRMPEYGPAKLPPPRRRAEVEAVLAGAPAAAAARPMHVVLVAGPKDHGPGEHDYPAWQKVWQQLLSRSDGVKVTTAWQWPEAADLKSADVLVFYQQGRWTPERARDIDAFLARGGGLVYIHYAVDGGADAPGFARRIGLAWRGGASKFRHGPLDVQFSRGSTHPVARNFGKVHFEDESYWQLVGDPTKVQLLATGVEDGEPQPLFWTCEQGKGRVFVSILGHFAWTFDDPLFRVLLLRGTAWAAREPVDRFNDLVYPGARVRE
jgi:putative heme-binding domain-containing protein